MNSRMEIHETGYAWRFIRACWTYLLDNFENLFWTGASMSLVGLLPPICENGNLLVDGGYSEQCHLIRKYVSN